MRRTLMSCMHKATMRYSNLDMSGAMPAAVHNSPVHLVPSVFATRGRVRSPLRSGYGEHQYSVHEARGAIITRIAGVWS